MPSNSSSKDSVLVDTSFLINLAKSDASYHQVAEQYYKEFINKGFSLMLSVIVIAEYQQGQAVTDLVASGNYRIVPYNYDDAIKTAEIAFNLSDTGRAEDESKANCKDDIKLIAQAETSEITYLITADKKTLYKYCEKLNKADLIKVKAIVLADGFDSTIFNNGQSSLI